MIQDINYKLNVESRLDHFLKHSLPNISRTKIQKLIKIGNIKVDGYIVKPSFILKGNEVINIIDDLIEKDEITVPEKIDLDIIYEDEDILVINKKSGIVVHPGIKNSSGTLLNGLLYYCSNLSNVNDRPGVIHRLDKETSGAIIFAKKDYAHYFIFPNNSKLIIFNIQ